MSRRVVITGMGIVSSIGIGMSAVTAALRSGRSGIVRVPRFAELGMRSRVAGLIDLDFQDYIDRRALRFMGDAAAYTHIAMQEAISVSGLEPHEVSHPRTGLIAGSGGGDTRAIVAAADALRARGIKRVGAFAVPKAMSSTVSACLATAFKIKGVSFSASSACSTSLHCITLACDEILLGRHDVMFAGGGESADWTIACLFDGMGALSHGFNDCPEQASRPYDADRDGFVIAAGGGMLVLEAEEHARARGARIYAEIGGYATTSDGYDMVTPSGEGAARCMQLALANCPGVSVDYINTHGTSTPVGDVRELQAIRTVFGERCPPLSSTKSMTGHALGAAGVNEAVCCALMMQHDFIAPSINVAHADEQCRGFDLVTTCRPAKLSAVLSNSFGFGGTNASLLLRRHAD